ncbi:hypothetical protein RP20_CCG008054 [Aedes albopictus]|nr:hypothetical protein RP20_CCG010534 [Aedes albopictus]KXJ77243.1 hypothetical protein RP20_CCG008054 [Aedes albopictus]
MKLFALIFFLIFALFSQTTLAVEKCPANSTPEGGHCVTNVIANGGCPDGFKYDVSSNKCRTTPATTKD